MNIDRKSFCLIVLLIAIALLLLSGVVIAREAPRYNAGQFSNLFVARNWPANLTDRFTVLGRELNCQPDDGIHWVCESMLEGKRLDITGHYMLQPYYDSTDCTVTYGGTPYACEVMLGSWGPMVMVNTDMGINPAQMAALRAQQPLMYINEATWIGVGGVWATMLASLITLVFLTAFNKISHAEVLGVRLPLWMLCLGVIGLASLISQVTGLVFVFPLGLFGSIVLLLIVALLNGRDRKQGPSLAHPVMWASVGLAAFWVTNVATLIGLMIIGYVD